MTFSPQPPAPIRVAFLIDRLSRAGTESQLVALLNALDRRRVEPHLILLDGQDEGSRALEPIHVPVLRLGTQVLLGRSGLRAMKACVRYLRNHQIDILQTYFLDSSYFGVMAGKLAGVPRIVRVRNNLGYWLTRRHRILGRLCRPFLDATVTNSDDGRAALAAEGVDPERIVVLENGVDLDRFPNSPPPATARSPVRIGAVANLRPVKNLDLLIRTAARIIQDRPDARFEIAGEGDQRAELERLIAELKVGSQVKLLGTVADIPGFLGSLDIAVLCSKSEGMSNALLEYMAAGRAIIATRVGAADRLLSDRKTALLIPPGDGDSLTAAVRSLLVDARLAARMGEAARLKVAAEFSREAMTRRFEEFYQSLLPAGPRQASVVRDQTCLELQVQDRAA